MILLKLRKSELYGLKLAYTDSTSAPTSLKRVFYVQEVVIACIENAKSFIRETKASREDNKFKQISSSFLLSNTVW